MKVGNDDMMDVFPLFYKKRRAWKGYIGKDSAIKETNKWYMKTDLI